MRGRIAAALACLGCVGAQPIAVQVTPYPEPARQGIRAEACSDPRLYDPGTVPAACVEIGDIFLGEAGNTVECSYSDLVARLREEICGTGANATTVVHSVPPSTGSTCHRLRALLLVCPQEVVAGEPSEDVDAANP